MPLYDYHCKHCDEMFEAVRPVALRNEIFTCPNCGNQGRIFLVMTGFAAISTKSRWEPASNAERLAGAAIRGPGATAGNRAATRNSVLHTCAGKSCAYCA